MTAIGLPRRCDTCLLASPRQMLQVHTDLFAVTAKHVHILEASLVMDVLQYRVLRMNAEDMSYAAWLHQHACWSSALRLHLPGMQK